MSAAFSCIIPYMEDVHLHFAGNVAQKAIIEHEGKILVCKGVGDTVWEFPGGRLHKDELPQEGLAREIKEELQLTLQIGQPVFITTSRHSKSGIVSLFIVYRCTVVGEVVTIPNEEVVEMCWIDRDALASLPMYEVYHQAALEYLRI